MTEPFDMAVQEAVAAARDGTDTEFVAAVVSLLARHQSNVLEGLLEELITRAADESITVLAGQPVDGSARLPSDEEFDAVISAAASGSAEGLVGLTNGTIEDLVVLLIGTLARLPNCGDDD